MTEKLWNCKFSSARSPSFGRVIFALTSYGGVPAVFSPGTGPPTLAGGAGGKGARTGLVLGQGDAHRSRIARFLISDRLLSSQKKMFCFLFVLRWPF